jgi:hypothetical protein
MAISWDVDIKAFLLFVTFHVAALDQTLYALFDHGWLRLESRDLRDNFLN